MLEHRFPTSSARSVTAFVGFVAVVCVLAASFSAAENLAYDQPAPTIHPRLTLLSRAMEPKVYKVTDRVYVAVGFADANSTMVIGDHGVVIIDTTESIDAAKRVVSEFRKISDLPVKGVIYTHHHMDHLGGAAALTTAEDVKSGKVTVVAHQDMPMLLAGAEASRANPLFTRELMTARFAYMFGGYLPRGPEGVVNNGTGPAMVPGAVSIILPTTTFADTLDTTITGVRLHLVHTPSETDDATAVWMPDLKVLQSGDVLMGETFPNLYTLRGGEIRNPVTWYRSIDRMREFAADHLVLSHGRPVSGRDAVAEVLTEHRDAIQYVHDQTVRFMNKGYTPDELAARISELPPHLKDRPYLAEFYGSVKSSVRQIYMSYSGWFTGDPTLLDPLPPVDRATRYLALMGGRERVIAEARRALLARDYRWAADVLTNVIRVNPEDDEARRLKAEALRQLGYRQANANFRNWYLTSALELDGQQLEFRSDWFRTVASPQGRVAAIGGLPTATMLGILGVHLDAQQSEAVHQTMAVALSDTGERCAVEIRRGVAQIHSQAPGRVDFTLTTSKSVLASLIMGQTTLGDVLDAGQGTMNGDRGAAEAFFGYFEPPIERWSDLRLTEH